MTRTANVRLLLVLAAAPTLGCYGKATPESCHAKYVRDRKGDDVRDTYEACLARAEALKQRIPEDVSKLRTRIAFETGCDDVQMTVLEFTGNAATLVGANVCGRRMTYSRRLRRHLGMRTTRNADWVVIADSAAPAPATTPVIQVNTTTNVIGPVNTEPDAPTTSVSTNPYAE